MTEQENDRRLKELFASYGLKHTDQIGRDKTFKFHQFRPGSLHALNNNKMEHFQQDKRERMFLDWKASTLTRSTNHFFIVDKNKFIAKSAKKSDELKRMPAEAFPYFIIDFTIDRGIIVDVRESFLAAELTRSSEKDAQLFLKPLIEQAEAEKTKKQKMKLLFSDKPDPFVCAKIVTKIYEVSKIIKRGKAMASLKKDLRVYFDEILEAALEEQSKKPL